jgi:hypothetical protein
MDFLYHGVGAGSSITASGSTEWVAYASAPTHIRTSAAQSHVERWWTEPASDHTDWTRYQRGWFGLSMPSSVLATIASTIAPKIFSCALDFRSDLVERSRNPIMTMCKCTQADSYPKAHTRRVRRRRVEDVDERNVTNAGLLSSAKDYITSLFSGTSPP